MATAQATLATTADGLQVPHGGKLVNLMAAPGTEAALIAVRKAWGEGWVGGGAQWHKNMVPRPLPAQKKGG